MPLIAPQLKQHREPLTIRLDVQLIALLKRYGEYIDSSSDYVASQVIVMTIGQDQEFRQWLRDKHPTDAAAYQNLLDRQMRVERWSGARKVAVKTKPAAAAERIDR